MFDSTKELLDQIRIGEDSSLELKEVRFSGQNVSAPHRDSVADELAAFANSRGGVLVLGVDDSTREILGIPVERLDAVERLIFEVCEQKIDPPLSPYIRRLWLPSTTGDDLAVLKVEVERSLFVHSSPRGFVRRIGSSKRQIPSDQLARLFQQRSQARLIRFDETPIHRAALGDLDEALWQRFVTPRTLEPPESMLSKLAMASKDDDGILRPTVAGVLLASRDPREFLSTAFIQAVAYRGREISPQDGAMYQRDALDITGPLDQQIFGACDFVRKNMRVSAKKRPQGGREDIPQFDMRAVFEALTNAVAHRDYSMIGSKIRLRIFDDRLELYVPGQLANTMTPDDFPYRQAARNEVITSLLARCPVERVDFETHRTHIMDRRGEGVRIILSRSEDLSRRAPQYRLIGESELMLTIYAPADSWDGD
ncbi:MAG: putative DNA binding domain-containing protein [Betaproteobacteria bacterium AqS2]|uniref:DNA binding domain-containing protein n=1 Tax=Candidatus Amphirhobacter heronislandensis TaxID=1732024 RepID=A0A930XXE6_9GAMM|nr:putative DNA binding domain-containing protein [Betaproteobacteria bacterium AqS2]